jgi:hypothetical protein
MEGIRNVIATELTESTMISVLGTLGLTARKYVKSKHVPLITRSSYVSIRRKAPRLLSSYKTILNIVLYNYTI